MNEIEYGVKVGVIRKKLNRYGFRHVNGKGPFVLFADIYKDYCRRE